MIVWTVYDHPADRPDEFVTRAFEIHSGSEPTPTGHTFGAVTVDLVRAWIQHVAPGSVCISRSEGDDPVILETWV